MKLKNVLRRIGLLLMAGIMALCLFSACGEKAPEVPMGRFTERQIAELAGVDRVLSVKTDADGDVVLYGFGARDGEALVTRSIIPADGGEIRTEEPEWINELLKGRSTAISVAESEDGAAYLLYMNEENQYNLIHYRNGETKVIEIAELAATDTEGASTMTGDDVPEYAGGEDPNEEGNEPEDMPGDPEEKDPSEEDEDESTFSVGGFNTSFSDMNMLYPTGITALENGEFLITYSGTGVYRYDAGGEKLMEYLCTPYDMVAVDNGRFAAPDWESGSIYVYDVESGTMLESIPYDGDVFDVSVALDSENVYVADGEGIHRLTAGGKELIVDGGLTSLMVPTYRVAHFSATGESEYLCILTDDDGAYPMLYRYDETVPSSPDRELNIFSLYDSNTIRQAIGEFQRSNPDVKVNLNVALSADGSGATVEDVIRTLNTELIAGTGPDLIVLDGLPVQSYIEKGVLADISELAAGLSSSEGLMENIMGAYVKDGKTYAVPSRFTLPVMVGDKGTLGRISSLSELADLVESAQGDEPSLLAVPDELWTSDQGIMMKYYNACAGSFINEDGSVNEAALAGFFSDMLRIDTTMKEHSPQLDESGMFSVAIGGSAGYELLDIGSWKLRDGTALVHLQELSGLMSLRSLGGDLGEMENMTLDSMFGSGLFYPSAGIGIASGGSRQELAAEFIGTLLSDKVQGKYLYDGFPVNGGALKALLNEHLGGDDPVSDMGFEELCNSLTTAVFVDDVIKNAVSEQLSELMEGVITPEQAAQNVVERTRLYLAE